MWFNDRPEVGSGIRFKWWKGKIYNQEYPDKLSFRFNGEIRSITDKQKLREFSTTKPGLQQMLKELL